MKLSVRIFVVWLVLALALLVFGCAGGGGGGGGTGGGSNNLSIAYHLVGFSGTNVDAETMSTSPQTVRVNVGGVIRTVNNVIIARDIPAGVDVTIISEGSELLNASIPNASQGLAIGDTGVRAPVSSDGVLQASVIARLGLDLISPAATWNGISMPNGFAVRFLGGDAGDHEVEVDGTIRFPSDISTTSGTLPITYSSPSAVSFDASFASPDFSGIGYSIAGGPGVNSTLTAPWSSTRASGSSPVFTTVLISSSF